MEVVDWRYNLYNAEVGSLQRKKYKLFAYS